MGRMKQVENPETSPVACLHCGAQAGKACKVIGNPDVHRRTIHTRRAKDEKWWLIPPRNMHPDTYNAKSHRPRGRPASPKRAIERNRKRVERKQRRKAEQA